MEESAGLAVVYKNKILLVHPTKQKWEGTYSIPKGKLEKGESYIDAAIRETCEETGINIPIELIKEKEGGEVNYTKNGRTYKKVIWFPVFIEELSQIGLDKETIKKEQLALNEVDWAGFLDGDELDKRIFWRFEKIIKKLKLVK